MIALEKVPDDRVSSYGIIETRESLDRVHGVQKFLEKPKATETTSRLGVIGKYVLTAEIFDYLEMVKNKDGEVRLADAFVRMIQDKDIYGLEIEGKRYDTGDKFGFLKATIDFALMRDDLGPQLKEYLENKMCNL